MTDKLETIREKCIEANPEIHRVFDNWASTHDRDEEQFTHEERPIRLADVLLAMEGEPYFIGTDGCWQRWDDNLGLISCAMQNSWNLHEDDLTKQSPETVDFLYALLS
jgi:hypothetical protein